MTRASLGSPKLVILCVGRTERNEFQHVLPALQAWGNVLTAPTTHAGRDLLDHESLTPDLIVLVQSYPGEFAERQIDDIRRHAPLARLVAVLGTWCEGEMRSGTPWSGAVRIYWHQWTAHCHLEMERLRAGRESLWSLPPTACDEERCLANATRKHKQGNGLVEICTEQVDVFDMLAAACHDRGFQTHWHRSHYEPPQDEPDVLLFDAARSVGFELTRFRRLHVRQDTVAIVLADFPRIADSNRFLHAGATTILSRPFFWDELFWYFPGDPTPNAAGPQERIRAVGGT